MSIVILSISLYINKDIRPFYDMPKHICRRQFEVRLGDGGIEPFGYGRELMGGPMKTPVQKRKEKRG